MLALVLERRLKPVTELPELTGQQVPNLSYTLLMIGDYGLVAIKKNACETQPIALKTRISCGAGLNSLRLN